MSNKELNLRAFIYLKQHCVTASPQNNLCAALATFYLSLQPLRCFVFHPPISWSSARNVIVVDTQCVIYSGDSLVCLFLFLP